MRGGRPRRPIVEIGSRNASRRRRGRAAAAIVGHRHRGALENAGRKTRSNRPGGHTALDLRELPRQILHAADTMQLARPGRAHPVVLRLGTGSIGRAHGGDGVERGVGGNQRRPVQMRLIQIGRTLRGVRRHALYNLRRRLLDLERAGQLRGAYAGDLDRDRTLRERGEQSGLRDGSGRGLRQGPRTSGPSACDKAARTRSSAAGGKYPGSSRWYGGSPEDLS